MPLLGSDGTPPCNTSNRYNRMDIPELIIQLLELKFRLKKENGLMQILVTTNNVIRVWFWMKGGAAITHEMRLCDWSTQSRHLIDECWETAKQFNLLDEQETFTLN